MTKAFNTAMDGHQFGSITHAALTSEKDVVNVTWIMEGR